MIIPPKIKKAIIDTGNSFIIFSSNFYYLLINSYTIQFDCKNKLEFTFEIQFVKEIYKIGKNNLVTTSENDCLSLITYNDELDDDTVILGDPFLRNFQIALYLVNYDKLPDETAHHRLDDQMYHWQIYMPLQVNRQY